MSVRVAVSRVDVSRASVSEATRAVVEDAGRPMSVVDVIAEMQDGGFRFTTELWPVPEEFSTVYAVMLEELRKHVTAGVLVESVDGGVTVFERPQTPAQRRRDQLTWLAVIGTCVALLTFALGMGSATSVTRAVSSVDVSTMDVSPVAMYLDTDAGATEGGSEPESARDCVGEDSECFNPCTMGTPDAQTGRPGPCDLGTPLPYGAHFQMNVTPGKSIGGTSCEGVPGGDGYTFVTVVVWVNNAQGGTVEGHAVQGNGCVPRAGASVSVEWVADLFVKAAQDL